MNQLIAKLRGKSNSIFDKYKKIISDEHCFSIPTGIQELEYNPETILEENQWFCIPNFSKEEYCLDLLQQGTFNSVDFETLNMKDFTNIEFICSYENNIFFFQKVGRSQLVIKKRLSFGEKFQYNSESKSIVINSYSDAFYIKETDTLYFQKLETISPIFKGIEILYREATNEETESFLQNEFLKISPNLKLDKIGKMNRKRIAIAINILSKFNPAQKQAILEYTKQNSGLAISNNSFVINTEEDLKSFLLGISERYYETPVSKEKRIANSIINITKKQ